jgi:hypothetical protein
VILPRVRPQLSTVISCAPAPVCFEGAKPRALARHRLVTFILLGDDNRRTPRRPLCEESRKPLLVGTMLLLFNLGCGGYGSGMGMTPATAPAISPGSGTYSIPLTDTISDGTPNAVIYVTEDGSTPSLSSPIYHGPFMITQSAKVEAIAAAGGYSSSPGAVANFTLQ